jgi:hypothetical protein
LVGDHGVNGEVKIWKCPAEVGKKVDLSLCALDLIGRGIVVYGIGGQPSVVGMTALVG